MKQVLVTFDFDPETDSVTNVKCSVDGVEKKKRTTKKLKDVVEEMASTPIITLESNKLIFNNRSVADMELNPEDRVVIKWKEIDNKMSPIIGKDIAFDEEGTGNKVTKSFTVTYKGKANDILADAGKEFTLVPYGDNIWRLISTGEEKETISLNKVLNDAESTIPELIVDADETTEIDELQFKF